MSGPTSMDAAPHESAADERPHALMHTMLRVAELRRSLAFYVDLLGMSLHRQHDFPDRRFSIAMVGYGAEQDHAAVELTHNWDAPAVDVGNAYGHLALATRDIHACCSMLAARGVKIVRPPGPMRGGPTLAFVEDPDGYRIELIETDDIHPLGRYHP